MLEPASLEAVLAAIYQPLLAFVTPSSRIFWGYLLSALLVGGVVFWVHARPNQTATKKITHVFLNLFSRRAWWHRSTGVDAGLWLFNASLRALVIVPLVGSHLVATLWVTRFLQSSFGDGPDWVMPLALLTTLYTLTFFIVEDFSRFGLHRLMHKFPFLWQFHKLHHSARRLTPLTLFRVHPIEMALYYLRSLLVFGGVSGVFVYLYGAKLSGWHVLGVDLLGFLFNLAAANLRHSHVWFPFGRFESWFISPAAHQLHHGRNKAHYDCNFGSCFSLWDRLFHSHQAASLRPARLVFGVKG